jgi:Lrp/AsnC family transcriptional regulator, regulator for asnA, asnC and gidA
LMRIVAVTDPVAVGRGVVATIGLRVSGDSRTVAARLSEIAEIEYVVVTVGAFDVLAEVVCATEEDLLDVLNDDIRTIDAVGEIQVLMHLRTEKNVFAWGQRLPGS